MKYNVNVHEPTLNGDNSTVDKIMSAVENVMREQSGTECRRNVWETIVILKERFPHLSEYIDDKLKEFANRYNTDFFEEIR